MSKKKRKPQKTPAPFEDRLQRCWDREDWPDVHQSVESIRDRARREMIARDIVTTWTVTDTSKKRDPERERIWGSSGSCNHRCPQ